MSNEKMGDLDNQTKPSFNEQCISYTDIANKLLKDKFLLTALELHSELVECGKEIPKLKEFFSNPGNFENQFSRSDYYGIQRSSSQVTLDSLDLTRYSEDGERGVDERVAVLEFELRKAKETIQALRANLTVATECETPTTESAEPLQVEPIKPHEQRALNFLINEYLLRHQYKLTSITFADENGDQDFEDWDDVGLNIPKPAELLQLYRDAMRQPGHSPPTPTSHWEGQTDLPDPQTLLLIAELEQLKEKISYLEREKAEMMTRIERLSTVEPVTTHFAAVDTEPEPERVSVHSVTPERFEVIEREVTARPSSESGSGERGDDNSSLNEWTRLNESETGSAVGVAVSEREEPAGAEDPPIHLPPSTPTSQVRSLPAGFQREVLSRCLVNTRVAEAALLEELLTQTDSLARLTHTLATSLPRLIPLVSKREELIPLLVCTVQLLTEPSQRDTLLQALFSLRKRPQVDERRAILAGLVWLARVCGTAVIEAELLPLCWEQMSHRHREHRLLVAEACSALAPYISAGLRNSLLLSILQQLLSEDREDVVRLSCVNSLALITAVMTDTDKYPQCEELTLSALQDSSVLVTEAALNTLLPVLGQWAAGEGWLGERLLTRLMNTLHTTYKTGESRWARAVPLVHSIRSLLPFLVLSVASVDVVTARIQPGLAPAESRAGFAELCQGLANPAVFYNGEFTVGSVMSAFDLAVKDTRWAELDWVVDVMLPKMMDVLEMVDVTNEELLNSFVLFFKSFAAGFGKTVTVNMLKPVFVSRLQGLEASLVSLSSDWPSLSVIPVYLLAVLAPLQSEEEEAGLTLQRFTVSLALSRAPIDCLQLSVSRLSRLPALLETVMAALWTGVVHPRPAVRALTADLFGQAVPHAGESMTTNRIVPALITLASDQEIIVKTATIPVFGKLVEHSTNKEVCDKTYFQLQTLLSDAAARDSHAAVLQLVATLGTIVIKCDQWFRDDVVVPWLAATAATTLQSTNQSRRLDLAAALVRAFNNVVYCELTNTTVTTALLPGLRYLEQICSQCLEGQHETVLSMIQEAESRVETPVKPIERSSSTITLAMATSNVGQGVEDMKNRVTKIFQTPISRPTNLPNLQSINIFRKK